MTDSWWGTHSLPIGTTGQWGIGPLRVLVQRLPHEWRLVAEPRTVSDDQDSSWSVEHIDAVIDAESYPEANRFLLRDTDEELLIRPALADRPVVTKPITPFVVPAGESGTIYVSTPLWFMILAGTPPVLLHELPIIRPSDTWFGASTMDGEVCYASRTFARLSLDNVPIPPFRAMTRIQIHNRAATSLRVERINLPVPYLSLYVGDDHVLWTETVTMVNQREGTLAEFHIERETAPRMKERVNEPRLQPQENMLVRAFGALLA